MRFAVYAGASSALATAVILRAFHQRPNFFSASVYLAQSQACRMILLNLLLLSVYGFVRALQKLLYGPLRAIEREQLWDRSWYAITETALAMTTFRDEVGAFFMIMFVTLLSGKVWGWISEGRVEILEQQPPANPRLFHSRLITSLLVSELFDIIMLRYCVNSLLEQPRPGMMVMFAFEFAVLLISSTSTLVRYTLSLNETFIVKRQTKARLEERRQEIRTAREEAERLAGEGSSAVAADIPREEDIEESDIDVPGWQEKGRWILFLDLLTDFLKLVVYLMFFTMLLLFHGIPIHIIRDVYLTARSFVKRISDFQKYRNATRDMNARYQDATAEELEGDGTCIICREDMHPWQQQPEVPPAPGAGAAPPNRTPPDEKLRPKKLPCGHILHLGCLKSWLERQQVCPTCRTSVLARNTTTNTNNQQNPAPNLRPGEQGQLGLQDQQNRNAEGQEPGNGNQNNGQEDRDVRARTFNIGPWRFTFAAGNANQVRDALQRFRGPAPQGQPQNLGNQRNLRLTDTLRAWRRRAPAVSGNTAALGEALVDMERRIIQEISTLQITQAQLAHVRALQQELARLRLVQGQIQAQGNEQQGNTSASANAARIETSLQQQQAARPGSAATNQILAQPSLAIPPISPHTRQQVLTSSSGDQPLGPGHPDLPSGITLPEGWSLLPLHPSNADSYAGSSSTQSGIPPLPEVTPQAPYTELPRGNPSPSNLTTHNVSHTSPETNNVTNIPSSSMSSNAPSLSRSTQNIGESSTGESSSSRSTLEKAPSVPDWSESDTAKPLIPDWGQPESRTENEALSTNGYSETGKGKAKAATVEDAEESDGVR